MDTKNTLVDEFEKDGLVRLIILDEENENKELDCFVLVNPNVQKIQQLDNIIHGNCEENKNFQIEDFDDIYAFINENFTIAKDDTGCEKTIYISWVNKPIPLF